MSKLPNNISRCAGQSPASGLDCRLRDQCQRHIEFKETKDFTHISVMPLMHDDLISQCKYMIDAEEWSEKIDILKDAEN